MRGIKFKNPLIKKPTNRLHAFNDTRTFYGDAQNIIVNTYILRASRCSWETKASKIMNDYVIKVRR